MSDTTATPPKPVIDGEPQEVAATVHVIPDRRIDLVPNVGFVVGDDAVLVVDTGMGPENGRRVLERARELAQGRPLLLTLTHFHPEHGFGAQVFRDHATIVYNEAQRLELEEKGEEFVGMFADFGPHVAEQLEGVELVGPHVAYEDGARIDLGGTVVELSYRGNAHTRGDQVVFVPGQGVLFAGDLVENRFFPILFDAEASPERWIALLDELEELRPAVVVPGHGAVGDAGLIRGIREYLVDVRARVRALHEQGRGLDEIKAALEPELRASYDTWDNPIWIGFAIEKAHAELA